MASLQKRLRAAAGYRITDSIGSKNIKELETTHSYTNNYRKIFK
jgi:hypothetical protein